MELANIEKLVEKYLNAETSLSEEAILKTYFTEEDVAPHLKEYESLFSYFSLSKEDVFSNTFQLQNTKSSGRNLKWMTIAASLALLITFFTGKKRYEKHQQEKTFAQVSYALNLLSNNLKKGEKAIAKVQTYKNTINTILK